MLSCDSSYHLLKVDINGIVQDALAVCFIHHDQSVHLQKDNEGKKRIKKQLQPIKQLLPM